MNKHCLFPLFTRTFVTSDINQQISQSIKWHWVTLKATLAAWIFSKSYTSENTVLQHVLAKIYLHTNRKAYTAGKLMLTA